MSDEGKTSSVALRLTARERAELERRAAEASARTGYDLTISDQIRHDIKRAAQGATVEQLEVDLIERLQGVEDCIDQKREAQIARDRLVRLVGSLDAWIADMDTGSAS